MKIDPTISDDIDHQDLERTKLNEQAEAARALQQIATSIASNNGSVAYASVPDIYQQQQSQNIVQVNGADLESVLSASQGIVTYLFVRNFPSENNIYFQVP